MAGGDGQVFATIGHCKGNLVAIRRLKCPYIDLSKVVLREFRQVKQFLYKVIT